VDALVLLAVTLAGFAKHNSNLEGGCWLTTILPSTGSPKSEPSAKRDANRKASGPGAVLFNETVIPIFMIVLGGVSALSITAWQVIWVLLVQRGFAWTKLR
jgi:hypothetical protein